MTSHRPSARRRCADCDRGLAHCHGTVLVHGDGGRECTEPGCDGVPARHALALGCGEAGCPCTGGTAERAA